MRPIFLASLISAALPAQGQPAATVAPKSPPAQTEPSAPAPPEPMGPFSKGKVALRGGLGLDVQKSINIGSSSSQPSLNGSAQAGVGYFIADGLSLDLDGRTQFHLLPSPNVDWLGLTPGARYHFDRFFVRAGAPLSFLPTFGLGVLAGAGYTQPLGDKVHLVVGADYTYYLTEAFRQAAPGGRIDLHGGIQTHF